jgi:hypothetical protein
MTTYHEDLPEIDMTHWNYRTLVEADGTATVIEAYYRSDGTVCGWIPAKPIGDDQSELVEVLCDMAKACALSPALTRADLP